MLIKSIPENFKVEEIFDIEKLEKIKKLENKTYFYFILKKINLTQFEAIKILSKYFKTRIKDINFSGTKDKIAITTQLITIRKISEYTRQEIIDKINNENNNLEIKYLCKKKFRLNLGDNLGNKFTIKIEEINIEKSLKKIEEIKKNGVLNLFGKQRFGFANNSHLIGKLILQNKIKEAIFMILKSCPKDCKNKFLIEFVEKFDDENLEKNIERIPRKFMEYKKILEFLIKNPTDYFGAFRLIDKKIRTIYISAYQSFLFNKVILNTNKQKIELVNFEIKNKKIYEKYLLQDNITFENFKFEKMPELKKDIFEREVRIFPKNFQILEKGKNFLIVSFELESGEYATTILECLE